MEERKEMPFGKKVRVGNFIVLKTVRSLSKRELRELRDGGGVPADVRKHLVRGGLPYIIVQTVGGGWSICFVCGTAMYAFIEQGCTGGDEGVSSLHNLFVLMYSDTAVLGDAAYYKAKGDALKAFMARTKAVEETAESKAADDKILDELKTEEEAKAAIVEMAEMIGRGEYAAHGTGVDDDGKGGADGNN